MPGDNLVATDFESEVEDVESNTKPGEVPAEENEDKLSQDTSTKSGEESAVENKVESKKVDSEEVEGIGADDPTGGDSVWNLNDNKIDKINLDDSKYFVGENHLGWLDFH